MHVCTNIRAHKNDFQNEIGAHEPRSHTIPVSDAVAFEVYLMGFLFLPNTICINIYSLWGEIFLCTQRISLLRRKWPFVREPVSTKFMRQIIFSAFHHFDIINKMETN